MSIKSITIENFKGIREPVKFELAPIVLLYGPNSAGKSTLLQALAYLNDIIVHDECNGNFTQVGGESMFLGDFASIVNECDMSKNIKFTFEIDALSGWDVVGFSSNPNNEYDGGYAQFVAKNKKSKNDLPLLTPEIVRDGMFVEFTVAWDFENKKAFLSCCRFVAQDVEIINIKTQSFKEIEGIDAVLAEKYHQKIEDIQEWLSITEWSQSALSKEMLNKIQNQLFDLKIIDKKGTFAKIVKAL